MAGDATDRPNLKQFMLDHMAGLAPAEFARRSGVPLQTVSSHLTEARPPEQSPRRATVVAYQQALGTRLHPLWDAIGRSIYGSDFDDVGSLLEDELPPGLDELDAHPALRRAIVANLRETVALAKRLNDAETKKTRR